MIALRGAGGVVLLPSVAAIGSFFCAVMVASALGLHDSFVAATLVPPTLVALGVMRLLGRPSLTVGSDGLLVREGRRETFLPYRALHSVVLAGGPGVASRSTDMIVNGLDGRDHLLRPTGRRSEVEAVASRIEAAILRHRTTNGDGLRGDLLERGGRSLSRWRADLEGSGQSFRTLAIPADHLTALLGDPYAPTEQRIGAALALRGESRARVRVVAAETVDPAVRAALDVLAEDDIDDARLEAALPSSLRRRSRA